jgi:hypothetical protein
LQISEVSQATQQVPTSTHRVPSSSYPPRPPNINTDSSSVLPQLDPSQNFDSSLDQIKFKSIENNYKLEASKLLQEHELLNLALTQKEEALLEMEQELEGVRREGVKLREEMRRRN